MRACAVQEDLLLRSLSGGKSEHSTPRSTPPPASQVPPQLTGRGAKRGSAGETKADKVARARARNARNQQLHRQRQKVPAAVQPPSLLRCTSACHLWAQNMHVHTLAKRSSCSIAGPQLWPCADLCAAIYNKKSAVTTFARRTHLRPQSARELHQRLGSITSLPPGVAGPHRDPGGAVRGAARACLHAHPSERAPAQRQRAQPAAAGGAAAAAGGMQQPGARLRGAADDGANFGAGAAARVWGRAGRLAQRDRDVRAIRRAVQPHLRR